MKSIANPVDHERRNEKKRLSYQNQVGLLDYEKRLKQMNEPSKNWRNSSRFSDDQKLSRMYLKS